MLLTSRVSILMLHVTLLVTVLVAPMIEKVG